MDTGGPERSVALKGAALQCTSSSTRIVSCRSWLRSANEEDGKGSRTDTRYLILVFDQSMLISFNPDQGSVTCRLTISVTFLYRSNSSRAKIRISWRVRGSGMATAFVQSSTCIREAGYGHTARGPYNVPPQAQNLASLQELPRRGDGQKLSRQHREKSVIRSCSHDLGPGWAHARNV